MSGYWNKFLRIDLTDRRVDVCHLEKDLTDRFIGGGGIAAALLYRETTAVTDALSPDNPLIAFTGPFTGTAVPAASRHHLAARSPQTGIYGESNVGGSWGVNLRRAGYDGLVVTGRAEGPVYLWITDDCVEIREASALWGQDTYKAAAHIKGRTDPRATIAVIGPAGERLAPIAGIPHIGRVVRVAARTGLGAVMGSKNLKAIAVWGTVQPPITDADGLHQSVKALLPRIKQATGTFGKFGTSGGVENYEKIGNFPIQNWRGSHWKGAVRISGTAMHDTILTGRKGCLRCPLACGRHIRVESGPYAGLDCEGPEYETIGTLGGECLIDDLAAICKANELCNRYGLDTISTGATIAFAMEAFEKGLITTSDTDGLELTWGNAEAMVTLVRKMGLREGMGELMSQGSAAMAKAIGHNADEFAVHVKGLEPSAHDPRRFFSQALSYATAARGACHNASWSHPYELALSMPEIGIKEPQEALATEGKAGFTIRLQDYQTANDCLVICRFAQVGRAINADHLVEWLGLIAGREVGVNELLKVGERVFNLKRLFNNRLGIGCEEDTLPSRFMTLNRQAVDLPNQLPPLDLLLRDYYAFRGWTEEGVPSPEKIRELGLEE